MTEASILINHLVDILVSFGPVGGVLLVFLESIIPPLPLGVIVGLNMLSFGNLFGFLISYVATIIGSMLSFYLFRYLFKNRFIHLFSKNKQGVIKKWINKLSSIDFNVLVVVFALPITPAFLLNIAGGLSDVSVRKYFIAMLVGKPAMLLFYGYVAVSFVDSLKDPINFVKIGVLVFLAYIISKIVEKIIKVEK